MKCLPPEVRNSVLEDVNDEVLSGETVGSYAEKLWLQTERFATDYVMAFNEVVNLYKLSTLKNLNVILELQNSDTPLPESEIAIIMCVQELNKAAETFAGSNDQWVKSSQSFILNVQRRLFQGTKGEEEQNVILAKEQELEDKEAASCACRRETGGCDWRIGSCADQETWHRELETRQRSVQRVAGIATERMQRRFEENDKAPSRLHLQNVEALHKHVAKRRCTGREGSDPVGTKEG